MGNLIQNIGVGTLIFLVAIGFHVLSAVLQAREKRKQELRKREIEQQRRMNQPFGADDGTGTGDVVVLSSPPTAPKADDLASRRKAQLEQLRQRRAAKQGAAGGTGIRVGTPMPKAEAPTGTGRTAPSIAPMQADLETARRQQQLDQQRKAEARARRDRENAMRSQREAQEAARRQAAAVARAAQKATPPAAPRKRSDALPASPMPQTLAALDPKFAVEQARKQTLQDLRGMLGNPRTLRELFLLKEILDRPLVTRDEPI